MARPMNFDKHCCIYCCKERLYGPLRHRVLNEEDDTYMTSCLPCKKLRDKLGLNHEDMMRYALTRAERQVRKVRLHLQEQAARRNAYSLDFREEFGSDATKREVAAARARKSKTVLSQLIAEWDEHDDT